MRQHADGVRYIMNNDQPTYTSLLWEKFNNNTATQEEIKMLEALEDVPSFTSKKPKRTRVHLSKNDKRERLPTSSLTKGEYDRYQHILACAYTEMKHINCRLSESDLYFIDSMTEVLDKLGRDANVSGKQDKWLEDIIRKIAIGKAKHG